MDEIMNIYRNLNYILSYINVDYILKTRKITSSKNYLTKTPTMRDLMEQQRLKIKMQSIIK